MKEADLAICIPTYNQCKFLPRAVRSALNQNVRAKVIAIGDDASTDETPQAMMDLLNTEPMLEYHRNEVNLGIAGNNSKLMSLTKSEFVVRLDSDDLLEPQYIQTLLPLMQAHPTAGYGHAAILQIDQNDEPIRHVHMNRRTGFQGPDEALKESIKSYRVAANIVIYRRQALEQVKYFKSRPDYCEDYDMSARLAAAGWGNVYSDEVLARYRIWTDNAGLRPRRKQQQLAGYCRIFDEVFQPAFAARQWTDKPLRRQRRHLAMVNSNVCFLPPHSAEETQRLVTLLRQLGGSRALELKLFLLQFGFAPIFERCYHARGRAKLSIKRMLARLRGGPLASSAQQGGC